MMTFTETNNNINTNINNINQTPGALFSIIFYDGEKEIDLGTIFITPTMNFKSFQSLLSQKIGISPHQITTYFTPIFNHNNHYRRRHPVTNKFNFSAAIPESKTSFFFVVLKRSRRVRRRRTKSFSPENDDVISPENYVLLRRNENNSNVNNKIESNEYLMDYETKLRLLEREQERYRYFMSMNLNSDVYSDLSLGLYNNSISRKGGINHNHNNNYDYDYDKNYYNGGIGMSSEDGGSSSGGGSSEVFCDVCLNARIEGETVPFHWCKNDAVTFVSHYRAPAGPIGPPSKNNK